MKCRNSHLPFRRAGQRGVALVLTLIMLAIITVVVVVFLLSSRRGRETSSIRLDQTAAEMAADTAYQRASLEIVREVLRRNDLHSFDFMVSRPSAYVTNGIRPLNSLEIPMVVNPPSNTVDVYLDLNRNRQFDDPGYGVNSAGGNRPYGDPIWLAINDRPWVTNSAPNNRAVARMAYVVLPAGKQLDLNTIHNEALPNRGEGFFRNQGFGPWELNLAAFLAELSPETWSNRNGTAEYRYGSGLNPVANGGAFVDARSIIHYRNNWRADLRSFQDSYPIAIQAPGFPTPLIDAYADGYANGNLLGVDPFIAGDDVPSKQAWPGSDPFNHWYNPQELFHVTNRYSPGKVTQSFYDKLTNVIAQDPLSYYRMMAQLGTDTGSDFDNRINLNYADHHVGESVTNFIPWDSSTNLAIAFFTNVAQRIFAAQEAEFNLLATNEVPIRSVCEIPIFPTNRYSAALHRIMQVAANIYDATRNDNNPTVFIPSFGPGSRAGDTGRYIVGWTVQTNATADFWNWVTSNTRGIPAVIGAKKGHPNFNEFSMRTEFQVTRKVELTRPAPGVRPNGTNEMYILSITNYFATESWYPYDISKSPAYSNDVIFAITNESTVWLSNGLGFTMIASNVSGTNTFYPAYSWAGGIEPPAFRIPFSTNQAFLSNSVYRFASNNFASVGLNDFEPNNGFKIPYWMLSISNRLTYLMRKPDGRILDFVILQDQSFVNLYDKLLSGNNPYPVGANSGTPNIIYQLWSTNRTRGVNGPTDGLLNQISVSLGDPPTQNTDWRAFSPGAPRTENDKNSAIDGFRRFVGLTPYFSPNTPDTNLSLAMQAPFTPAGKIIVMNTWQVNDPIVHYHAEDLRIGSAPTNSQYLRPNQPSQSASNLPPSSLGRLNSTVYSPWGGNPFSSSAQPLAFDRTIIDPGVSSPDDWRFPNGKLATVGLLGRVHRGTPWQTVYLKSEAAPLLVWTNKSSDLVIRNGRLQSRTHPTNDWKLMDLFTTAIDERTSRGLMSINVTNLESWSALLSGVLVLSNSQASPQIGQPRVYTEMQIAPHGDGGTNTQMIRIWSGITNLHFNNSRRTVRALQSVGDLLSVPELTVQSPFLNLTGNQLQRGLDDFAYEQIPAQILSLLRVGEPRFVIYAYGQALKPVSIDPASGLVSNYQVTGEYATRTVVRLEGDPSISVRMVVESFNVLPPD